MSDNNRRPSRGERNNNPGNLVDGRFTRSQPGYVGSDGHFARFRSMADGEQAQVNLLVRRYGGRTPTTLIRGTGRRDGYAPSVLTGGDNTEAQVTNYIGYIAARLGIGHNDAIPTSRFRELAGAMREFETGRRAPGVRFTPAARARGGEAGDGYTAPTTPAAPARDFSGDWLNMRPQDASQRPMPAHVNSHDQEDQRIRRLVTTTGRSTPYVATQSDSTPLAHIDTAQTEVGQVRETERNAAITPWDRLTASVSDNALTAALYRSISDQEAPAQDGFMEYYLGNIDEIESFARDEDELAWLREANSELSLQSIRTRIEERRARRNLYMGSGVSTSGSIVYSLLGGLLDPVGIAAGLGVGKLLQTAGVGARTLYLMGRPIAGTVSLAAEGAIGNLAIMGAMDMSGEHFSSLDYAASGAFGASIGTLTAPFVWRGNRPDTSVMDVFDRGRESGQALQRDRLAQAEQNLGPGATPDTVAAEVVRLDRVDREDHLRVSLADQPDEARILSDGDSLLTRDQAVRADIDLRHNLDGLSDDAERSVIAEMVARAERIDRDNPLDADALSPATIWIGQQSTGIDLLRSNSVVARALGRVLTEGTTGAGGRRRTAAMSQAVRERLYNQEIRSFSDLYHQYRRAEGRGIIEEAWDGRAWNDFERRVFMELERRGDTPDGTTLDANPLIGRAADLLERGFSRMRAEQQYVGTIGAARLGSTSRGYVPHRLLGSKVLGLSNDQQRSLRNILSRQFQDPANGFDRAFSDRLAARYLEQAKRRALGGYDVPISLHTPEAADIVRDALEAMRLPVEDIDKLMGKYSRGGAGHTQRRLRLDLDSDIGDGMKLADLFDTSVSNLYRGYARRVSGEVALAQYGIMGRKGLMLARTAIESTGGDAITLRAFDQVAAEFLNTPFGGWNHKYMDNVRILTSLSRLGGMGFTQMGEYGNGIAALGAHRVFASIGSMPRLMREVHAIHKGGGPANPVLQSLDQLGGHLGLDDYTNTRLFDVRDNDIQVYGTEQIGLGTRTLRAFGNLQAVMSGHRMILAVQTRGMAEQIIRKAVAFARRGGEDKALDDMGINAELRAALRANMDRIATFDGDRLRTLDLMAGDLTPQQIMSIRDGVERGASQIIQRTYTGETGKWAHNGFLKMLLQFRTFGVTAVEKQWGRNRANHGALRSLMYLVGAMSFAAPIHVARVQTKMLGMSEAEADAYADRHLNIGAIGRATLNYASSAGLAGDILDVGVGAFGGATGIDLGTTIGARGQLRGNVVGGMIAPGVGMIEDINKGVHGDTERLLRALPFANLPYVQPGINAITDD